jgi:protocatechuate 3,4-dioxygenase, beta subunit
MSKYLSRSALMLLLLWPLLASAREPVIGGPCDGCEHVFEGMPAELHQDARIAPAGEPGEGLVIHGAVTGTDGAPAVGVVVYAYQTNAKGIYPRAANAHGSLRGWARTDAQGRYRFDTIRPASYPDSTIPQHVHMHIIELGKGTYYIDDVLFDDDPLLTAQQRRQMLRGRGGSGLAQPVKNASGVWQVRRDIRLGANIPGYR